MGNKNDNDVHRRQSSNASDDGDSSDNNSISSEGENEDKTDNKPTTSTNNNKKDSSNEDIKDLTEELGGVSIAPSKPSLAELTAPESLKSIADLISSNKYKNIIVLTGAGVSCNAGIPDFRTPGTGLYDNLAKYNLPYPEAVFDVSFYKNNPDPFIQLASELWPGKY